MEKSLLIFIAIGVGFLYFITDFVGDIQKEDDVYANNEFKEQHQYDKYNTVDSIGQELLDVSAANESTQIAAWQASRLKQECFALFPNFSEMKTFVKERTRGDKLHNKLLNMLNNVEDKFFSGKLNAEKAKQMLDSLE